MRDAGRALALILGSGIVACPPLARAGSCAPPDWDASFAAASVVFLGTVTRQAEHEVDKFGMDPPATFTFSVEGYYKGRGPAELVVGGHPGDMSFGPSFRVGGRYLVFPPGPTDALRVNHCTPNLELEPAPGELSSRALAVLGGLGDPPLVPPTQPVPTAGCGCTAGPDGIASFAILWLVLGRIRRRRSVESERPHELVRSGPAVLTLRAGTVWAQVS